MWLKNYAYSFVFSIIFFLLSATSINALVTYQASHSKAWWNENVTVNGTARYDGNNSAIQDAQVNITIGSIKCNNTTDTSGNYRCIFGAPKEVGKYEIFINVTNSTGYNTTNTTKLAVELSYGSTPSGTIDRVVHEVPILIQEMSGRIRVVIARIMVWRV